MSPSNITARTAALQALLAMKQNDGYSNLVLDGTLASAGLDRRDRALASALFYGVLERRLTLDYYLAQCLRDPRKKPDPTAQEALRCGAYQILYMDRVPDAAAVNETVNALKALGGERYSGFVNGVLRGLIRKKRGLRLPEGTSPRALSLRYSVPEELICLWQRGYGEAVAQELLEASLTRPELYVRVNQTRTTGPELQAGLEQEGLTLAQLEAPAGAAVLAGCGDPAELRQFQEGLFHVQDLSAQWVCEILNVRPGETVWDCCAAPGGKAFTLAQAMGSTGMVYATDLYPSRVRLMEEGAQRLGLENLTILAGDATQEVQNVPLVDKLLCDAPCSGFGVIRRKPEIRYKSLAQVKELPALQRAILHRASEKLKPGGLLVYSTCTWNPAENRAVAEAFLKEHASFLPEKIEIGVTRTVEEPEYMLTMTPKAGASDGFFAAAFRKKQG